MSWFAQAPSNIALIKYMGKKEGATNLPANPSLSYTLNNLQSSVMLESQSGKRDFWEPLQIPGGAPFSLSKAGQERFLAHLNYLKTVFGYTGAFIVRSSNNFPQSSGLASSASSFAALTLCGVRALCELTGKEEPSQETQAKLSRLGSGSSCRSFFAPWTLWQDEHVGVIDLPYPQLLHQVVLISHEEKQVPSSEAHQRVTTSPDYKERPKRATENLQQLLAALRQNNWQEAYQICWREFEDMHHLFESCATPFSYLGEESKAILKALQALWQQEGDGPIVTMDAGPNIHLLYRPDQAQLAQRFKNNVLTGKHDVL